VIVQYYGNPNGRIFGRAIYQSFDNARMDAWNHWGLYYDLHDTDVIRTRYDEIWDSTEVSDA